MKGASSHTVSNRVAFDPGSKSGLQIEAGKRHPILRTESGAQLFEKGENLPFVVRLWQEDVTTLHALKLSSVALKSDGSVEVLSSELDPYLADGGRDEFYAYPAEDELADFALLGGEAMDVPQQLRIGIRKFCHRAGYFKHIPECVLSGDVRKTCRVGCDVAVLMADRSVVCCRYSADLDRPEFIPAGSGCAPADAAQGRRGHRRR